MRTLVFVAAFALIGSAAGAQTMSNMNMPTTTATTTPTATTTTTVRTHTHTSTTAMHSNRHMMRHCMKKGKGHKMACKKSMMNKKMADMPNM